MNVTGICLYTLHFSVLPYTSTSSIYIQIDLVTNKPTVMHWVTDCPLTFKPSSQYFCLRSIATESQCKHMLQHKSRKIPTPALRCKSKLIYMHLRSQSNTRQNIVNQALHNIAGAGQTCFCHLTCPINSLLVTCKSTCPYWRY